VKNSETVHELMALLEQGVKTYHQVCKKGAELYDLTASQARVLQALKEKEPQTLSEITKKLNLSAAFVSNTMDQLEKRGFLVRERDETDRRVVWHVLTETSREVVSDLEHFQACYFTDHLSDMKEREIEAIKNQLESFIQNLGIDKSKGEK
jgi:DNA-binding MarR family transcriptional regulator